MGEETVSAQEARRRPGGDPPVARWTVEPPVARAGAEASDAAGAARVPRFWADLDRRICGARARPGGGQRDSAEMDDRRGTVETETGASGAGANLAGTAGMPRGTVAVGHQRACVAGGSRASDDVLGGADRRCHQYAVRAFCGSRHNGAEHAGVVGLPGALRPAASGVHRQGGDVSTDAATRLEDGRSRREDGNADWTGVAGAGD